MNREIEFRIYDKKLKEFNYIDLCDLAEGDDYWFDGETSIWNVMYDATHEQERFVIMQYIGLKDGKKIFEGDILKMYQINLDNGEEDGYGTMHYDYDEVNVTATIEFIYTYSFTGEFLDDIEVIGTIFDKEDNNEK